MIGFPSEPPLSDANAFVRVPKGPSTGPGEESQKTKKPAATTGVTAGSIDCDEDFRRDAEQDARPTQPEKATDGFSGVKNGRYRTRTYDP